MPDRLVEQARVLADRVGALSEAVEHLDHRTNRGERITIAVIAGLVTELILSVAVVFTLVQVNVTQNREATTRQLALCPLYSLILGSYNPDSRPEGDARNKYNQQFDIMRQAYGALDCVGPVVPPAIRR